MNKLFLIFGVIVVTVIVTLLYSISLKDDIDTEMVLNNFDYILTTDRYSKAFDNSRLGDLKGMYNLYNMPGSPQNAKIVMKSFAVKLCKSRISEGWEKEIVNETDVTYEEVFDCYRECMR